MGQIMLNRIISYFLHEIEILSLEMAFSRILSKL